MKSGVGKYLQNAGEARPEHRATVVPKAFKMFFRVGEYCYSASEQILSLAIPCIRLVIVILHTFLSIPKSFNSLCPSLIRNIDS